jgi:hypothetical protein
MTIFSADINFSPLALYSKSFLCIFVVVHATFIIAKSQHIYMTDARRIPKSVMLIKQICVHVQS